MGRAILLDQVNGHLKSLLKGRKLESGNSGVLRDYYLNSPQEIVAYRFVFRKSDKVNFALHTLRVSFLL